MTAITGTVPQRERLHGVRQIVRFNWPFYATSLLAVAGAMVAIERLPLAGRALLHLATAPAWFWMFGSLAVSWWVYDRSNLMSCEWLPALLPSRPTAWISLHAGLDETSPALRAVLASPGRILDIFDASQMTEGSIARARSGAAQRSEAANFRRLPLESGSVDLALVLLSAHELRTDEARVTLFRELRRALTPGGRIVVTEHLRDVPNFLAFGPGALHFHSRRTWRRCFTDAGLSVREERAVTRFVKIFVLSSGAA